MVAPDYRVKPAAAIVETGVRTVYVPFCHRRFLRYSEDDAAGLEISVRKKQPDHIRVGPTWRAKDTPMPSGSQRNASPGVTASRKKQDAGEIMDYLPMNLTSKAPAAAHSSHAGPCPFYSLLKDSNPR